MTLHKKIMIYVGLSTFLLLSIQYLISERSIMQDYEALEISYSKEGLKRVLLSFYDEYRNLGAITINYAGWDDTYHFIERPDIPSENDPYLTVNYSDSLFESSRLNFALLFNNRKQVFLGKSYDFLHKRGIPDASSFIEDLRGRHASFIEHPNHYSRKQGVLVLDGKPILAASDPILTSDNQGPVHGSLVFARYIDDDYIQYISEKADIKLNYRVINSSFKLPAQAAKMVSGSQELYYWVEQENNRIHCFAVINDIDDQPAIVLEYSQPRDFSKRADKNINFYMLYYGVSGLALFAIAFIVLQRKVFRRLNQAVSGMRNIEREQDFSLRIAETGNDELTDMEKSFNRMMDSLELTQKEIIHQAHHDTLTELPNRKAFFIKLKQLIESRRGHQARFAVLFIDLDRFKCVNDTLGHHAGDLLLIDASSRIKQGLLNGEFLFRLGGDEFCIICSYDGELTRVERLATGIKKALDTPFELEGQSASISASIGISLYPEHGEDCENLLQHADSAMLAVKDSGRASYRWYTASVDAERKRRLTMENLLLKAIDNQELLLHYQPKWDLNCSAMTGVEALLRWNSPQLGSVPPSEFIPIAEATGLINEIGEWIMRTACRQYKEWQRETPESPLSVAVNISGAQLLQSDFVERVRSIFAEEGVDPNGFEFEVTESFAITNFDQVIDVLTQLREMGLTISIDDFGAGYSSLKYLCKLPIQIMKIDKSLVDRLSDTESNRVVLSAIIDMAHRLGLIVVAEGVETVEQLDFLREKECDRIQGYLLCRPVPPERIANRDFGF